MVRGRGSLRGSHEGEGGLLRLLTSVGWRGKKPKSVLIRMFWKINYMPCYSQPSPFPFVNHFLNSMKLLHKGLFHSGSDFLKCLLYFSFPHWTSTINKNYVKWSSLFFVCLPIILVICMVNLRVYLTQESTPDSDLTFYLNTLTLQPSTDQAYFSR